MIAPRTAPILPDAAIDYWGYVYRARQELHALCSFEQFLRRPRAYLDHPLLPAQRIVRARIERRA